MLIITSSTCNSITICYSYIHINLNLCIVIHSHIHIFNSGMYESYLILYILLYISETLNYITLF